MSQEYVALADGAASFRRGFSGPALLRMPLPYLTSFVYGPLTLSGLPSHAVRLALDNQMSWSYNPTVAVTTVVWAPPRSLATTWGIISYFLFLPVLRCFSSRRLPSYKVRVPAHQAGGLPHSEISGYNGYVPLPQAYRSLSRPSSPLRP